MLREKLAVSGLISLAMITMITFNSSLGLAKGATPLEPATEQALRETQQGLTNPAERAKMIQGDAKAEAYDANDRLFKTFTPKKFKKLAGRWQLKEMEIRNVRADSKTTISFDLPDD